MDAPFALSVTDRLARARADLRAGLPLVLRGGGRRVVALAAEGLGDGALGQMRGLGLVELAVTQRRAEVLKLHLYDGDLVRLALPERADAGWVQALADPADDLAVPMKGPLNALRGGDATLARLGLRLAKAAHLLPAVLLVETDLDLPDLTALDAETAGPALDTAATLSDIAHARVPLSRAARSRVHVFRPEAGGEEHYAAEIGQPARDGAPLVRLHSACFTGDVLGSLKCDCGPQLHAALDQMGAAGEGVLLYLNQEGRGIGLANKMRAYSLQDQGFDTVEANHRLGFEDDERDFRLGSAILREMGFSRLRLLTNNPRKVAMMEAQGLEVVERVPLHVGRGPLNEGYLATKAAKSGHLL